MSEFKILTQTALRTFRKCPRLYQHQYLELYRPVQVAEPLRFGDLWHKLREAWWRGDLVEGVITRLPRAVDLLTALRADPNYELDEFTTARLIVMLQGYHERWQGYVDACEVIGVEQKFDLPLINPRTSRESRTFRIQGQLDAVIRSHEDGRLWVVEEKTAGEDLKPESPYWRRLEVDPQISVYYAAVAALFNEQPAGVKYFVNVKPQLRPLKMTQNLKIRKDGKPYAGQRLEDETAVEYAKRMAEAVAKDPERFYQMLPVARLERDIYESQVDVWDTAIAIRQAETSDTWLRNPDSCIHPFGSACSFLPVCTHRASLDDQMLYRRADVQHEELQEKSV